MAKYPMIRWLKPMNRVLYALAPAMVLAVYFYGWRALVLLAVVNAAGFVCEYAFVRQYGEPVSSSVFVTGVLLTLSLPPTIPYWMAVLGMVVAVVFGKMVFGGFGRNVFNPALVGRAFLYVSFSMHMTARWLEPFAGGWAGFLHYSGGAMTSATPLAQLAQSQNISLIRLFTGFHPGCLGETSAMALILGGCYLLAKKIANYRIVIACLAGMVITQTALWAAGIDGALSPVYALVSGGFMLGVFFMATDPVSACQTNTGRWLYGGLIGLLTALIRTFSVWPEGVMFAILLANTFGPIIDFAVKARKSGRSPS